MLPKPLIKTGKWFFCSKEPLLFLEGFCRIFPCAFPQPNEILFNVMQRWIVALSHVGVSKYKVEEENVLRKRNRNGGFVSFHSNTYACVLMLYTECGLISPPLVAL